MKEITIDGVAYILTPKEEKREHEYVDLGLPSGRLWATCNIGAKKPTDSGDYFAWGDTEPINLDDVDLYVKSDNIVDINNGHDTATVLWGKEWCMPTLTDFAELIEYTDYKFVKKDELSYAVYKSKINKNKLILPAAGLVCKSVSGLYNSDGCYWSRTRPFRRDPWRMKFDSEDQYVSSCGGFLGCSIRPVLKNTYINMEWKV